MTSPVSCYPGWRDRCKDVRLVELLSPLTLKKILVLKNLNIFTSVQKKQVFSKIFNFLSISTIGKLALYSTAHTFNALITPWTLSQDSLPLIIITKGFDSKRQWYFYDNIRGHCPNKLCNCTKAN